MGGSSEGSGLGSENWEMGVTESGDQSRNRNQQRRSPRPFLRPNASLKTPGPDKPECGATAGEGELWGRQAQSGTSLKPELGVPEVARGRHGVPEDPGIPRRTRLQLRLPEVSFTHHRCRHLGSTCRRDDVSGSGVSPVMEFNSARCRSTSVAPVVAVRRGKADLAPDP